MEISTFEWHMTRFVVKNEHQKDMWYNDWTMCS